MPFRRAQTRFDRKTGRAYVELRSKNADGGETLAVAIFSFRITGRQSNRQIEQDLRRKARQAFTGAANALAATGAVS